MEAERTENRMSGSERVSGCERITVGRERSAEREVAERQWSGERGNRSER